MGNTTPRADLVVVSPKGTMFLVDVKGQRQRSYWIVREKDVRGLLFYILAFVPQGKTNEFFVMTQQQVNGAIAAERRTGTPDRQNLPDAMRILGVPWRVGETYRDQWGALPD